MSLPVSASVRPGLLTPVRVTARIPASVKVRYVGAPDADLSGVTVTSSSDDGPPGRGRLEGSQRETEMWGSFVAGQEITLATALPGGVQVPVRRMAPLTVALRPGENAVEVPVEPMAEGLVAGTVRTPAGDPAIHARITLLQHEDERDWQFATETDEQGHYELSAVRGPAQVLASFRDETQPREVTVGAEAATADFQMTDTQRYQVELDLETRLPGAEDFTRTNVDWRVAVHFGLSAAVNGTRTQDLMQISRQRENTFPVEGRPGEKLTVCGSGSEASGLPR
jgi:hypothetical protein